MSKYTINKSFRISETQDKTLKKMKLRGVDISRFIRDSIAEKINKDYQHLKEKPKKIKCPF